MLRSEQWVDGVLGCWVVGPGNMKTMEEINTVPRGTTNLQAKAVVGELLNDLLWSDPTDHDSVTHSQELSQ